MEWRDIKSGEEPQEPQEQERMIWEVVQDRVIRIASPGIPLVIAVVQKFPKNDIIDIDYKLVARTIAAAPAMLDILLDIILDGTLSGNNTIADSMVDEIGSLILSINGGKDTNDS